MDNTINIFTSNCTRKLALKVVDMINIRRAYSEEDVVLGECNIEYFKNKEITCDYQRSIRRKPVYIFGDTGTENIVELLIMLDAAKRAAPSEIHIVLPCYGYARQDKKEGKQKRGPIGAKLMADLLSVAAGRKLEGIIVIDLHAEAIEGFFDVPVNHINGTTIFKDALYELIKHDQESYIIASPDAGGKQRATRIAKKLNIEIVGMDKTRVKPGEVADISLVGDVSGKNIIIVDDMVDSGGTLIKAADYLIAEKKALSVQAVCTHPYLTSDAVEKIVSAKNLSSLMISDTVQHGKNINGIEKIKVVSSATILSKIIGGVLTKGTSMNAVNS